MGNEMCTLKYRVPKSKGAKPAQGRLNSLCPHKGLGLNPRLHVGPPAQWVPLPGSKTDRPLWRGHMPFDAYLGGRIFFFTVALLPKKGKDTAVYFT